MNHSIRTTARSPRRILAAMMRNIRATLAVTVLVTSFGASGAAQASPAGVARAADTRPCVSMREAEQVEGSNLTLTQIHRIFDTRGRFVYQDEDQYGPAATTGREYRSCRRGTIVQVDYKRASSTSAWRWWNQALFEP